MQQYRLLAAKGYEYLPYFKDVGFRKYSQFEEDGILLYIFSLISPINRTCVEICAGSGLECNTTNLIINHGWWGHLFDGNEHNVKEGKEFFSKNRNTFLYLQSLQEHGSQQKTLISLLRNLGFMVLSIYSVLISMVWITGYGKQ